MIRRLVSTRLEDIRDGFEEELQETKPMKKPFQNSEKLTDSEDEYEVPAKIPKQAYENRGAALLAKMGYDGGGLGKSGQGRTELIPFSTQRGREGFGQPANQKIARDWNVIWDFAEEKNLWKKMYCGYLLLMTFERNSQKICKIKTTGLLLET
ncbi:hypothetical protein WUBG_15943 [Wuchereria bancrofti]|uniref:G-patch domain-containing protein n=1 Tax=Wuchereria bancrofti TaxID=6293 RepID=J9DU07_WUCBA|nr:hypothetical protein WUBG_15943 [Wuchereria bancrofti]